MAHVVTAPAVQVTAGGRTFFVETGATLPVGVDAETIERLEVEGMIAPAVEVVVEVVVVEPYEGVTIPDLKAEIEKRNEGRADEKKISATGNRPDLVAALVADDAAAE